MNRGANAAVIAHVCERLPCQVGGGVRTPECARTLIESGARRVIVGSALYGSNGVKIETAHAFQSAVGDTNWIAAIDTRGDRVVVDGWASQTQVSPVAAIHALEPYTRGFLYTNVDREGLLQGFDMGRAQQLRATTTRKLIVAGGIRSQQEIDELDRMGVDSVVGMAVYRGLLPATPGP